VNVEGRVAVVTGGAGGIGAELSRQLGAAQARVVIVDLDEGRARAVADRIGPRAVALGADASSSDGLASVMSYAEEHFGPVDLFFANAGVFGPGGLGESDQAWQHAIDVNVMAHVRAARILLPQWLVRREGCFVSIASAAGLLSQIGAAPYSATKHAAVAFAEWLSITYGDQGVQVTCVCPMGVNTAMLANGLSSEDGQGRLGARVVAAAGEVIEPTQVASLTLEAVRNGRFLVLPHPEVQTYVVNKATDHERWLAGMRRLQAAVQSG
jgi:NAD(P)-dependent dehydrogenase (short-subunit alcohol dehydrogenase family)